MGADRNKKDDDEGSSPFQNLDKGLVLQEKTIFNETPLNPRKCCHLLTKILYLVIQGDKFTRAEATDVFFSVTRLFQSKDIPLRRLVYLVLKELMGIADDVIIIMSSLTKDMTNKIDVYRANAIRVLCGITDGAMLTQVERYLKQAIVDKEPYVSSAALVSGIHLVNSNPDIVKRWGPEVQEALQSKSTMVQYHALGLLHMIKRQDRLAVSKLVTSMTKSNVRSNYAHCLLIRFTAQVMEEDPNANEKGFYSYLETCLRHKNEMVIYEAARTICNLKGITPKELTPAITVLQLFLSSPKATLRFAAARTLSKVAQTYPLSVTTCNLDLENLITDSNRSIATLAITTLLKTGSESSVDRLMKQISSFMGEISDEFKIVVVEAIRALCVKFPQKQRTLLTFLSNILRDEGGFEYKKTIVETILNILEELPEAKEAGLTHLCEFIEDCEFPYLSTKILHLLGKEGPNTSCPSRYIRYIYNRISLENASVRASAVSALAKFGVKLPDLRKSIIILLKRCLHDPDDEVRDRATFYLQSLETQEESLTNLFIEDFKIPILNLQQALSEYQAHPSQTPFDIRKVSLLPPMKKEPPKKATATKQQAQPIVEPKAESQDLYAAIFASLPQFSQCGTLFKSSKPIELTESETEYVVHCVKHIFDQYIVFQFNITNTLREQLLENVTVKIENTGIPDLKFEFLLPLEKLPYGQPGQTYVCMSKKSGDFPRVREIDPSTNEPDESSYEDEYKVDDLELLVCDYMQPTFVTNFQEKWDEIGDEFEVVETYALSAMKSLQAAVDEVIKYLGMQACDRTDKVPPKRSKHILLLSGNFIGNIPVFVRVRMKFVEGQGAQMELTARSKNDDINTLIAGAI